MGLPKCRACGHFALRLHHHKASSISREPAYYTAVCANPKCHEIYGVLPDLSGLDVLDHKLEAIMKALKLIR